MSYPTGYEPAKIWTMAGDNGGTFSSINRPTSGAKHEKDLPGWRHPLQLYSQGTPNGVKITIMLEELLLLGHSGAEYDAWVCRINDGDSVIRANGEHQTLKGNDEISVLSGDVVVLKTPGGGGFGER